MIPSLRIVIIVLWVIEAFAVLLLLAIAADMMLGSLIRRQPTKTPYSARHSQKLKKIEQEKLRVEKERSAHRGFFEESHVRIFDPSGASFYRVVLVATAEAVRFYREMDQLAGDHNFQNTKDL